MTTTNIFKRRVTLLAGGVGAARFLRGLARVVDADRLTVVVNTGDDETFFGLRVSPDIDTIVYTLAGLAPRSRGWGIRGDGYRVTEALERYYGPAWFRIGDRDVATHIYRSDLLARGYSLSRCTQMIAHRLGVTQTVLPATDDPVRTIVRTRSERLAFQDYLVKRRARPAVVGLSYTGARKARAAKGVLEAISGADILIIAPSNPLVSIRPILAVPAIAKAVRNARSRCIAVSPLMGGRAVKGPLDRMLRQQGLAAGTTTIARIYRNYAATLVVDPGDRPPAFPVPGLPEVVEHPILCTNTAGAYRLARFVVRYVTRDRKEAR